MARTVTLKDDKIIDSWATIIDSGTGKAEMIFEITDRLLKDSDPPDVSWERVDAQPGMIKGLLLSKKRDYLRIVSKGVGDEYRMYIGARDFGTHLDVTWFLTVEPNWFKRIGKTAANMATLGAAGVLLDLDLFDQQDLRAYVTVAHHCLIDAVKIVMAELGQDVSKIDPKSKGVLEVW